MLIVKLMMKKIFVLGVSFVLLGTLVLVSGCVTQTEETNVNAEPVTEEQVVPAVEPAPVQEENVNMEVPAPVEMPAPVQP
jgi:Na+-transporting methylmalonyl-CoA/oxaloacetate decarboxylase gamma subunit